MRTLHILSIAILFIFHVASVTFATEEKQPETDKERLQRVCLDYVQDQDQDQDKGKVKTLFSQLDDVKALDICELTIDYDIPFSIIAQGLQGNTTTHHIKFVLTHSRKDVEAQIGDFYDALQKLESLTSLSLKGSKLALEESKLEEFDASALNNFIQSVPKLKILNLRELYRVEAFMQTLQLPITLKELIFAETFLSVQEWKLLANGLQSIKESLTYLDISSCNIGNEELGCLVPFLKENSLTYLDVSDNNLEIKDIELIFSLFKEGNNEMKSLNIDRNLFDIESWCKLQEQYAPMLSKIKIDEITDRKMKIFKCSTLEDEHKEQILALYNKSTKIEQLNFSTKHYTSSQLINDFFPYIDGGFPIRKFSMTSINMGGNISNLIPILHRYAHLVFLNLSNNQISTRMISNNIENIKKLTNLSHFDLSSNKIKVDGFKIIFDHLGKQLSFLGLAKNQIEIDQALKFLKDKEGIQLKTLDLCDQKENKLEENKYLEENKILEGKFPNFQCILNNYDDLLFAGGKELPIKKLIVVSDTPIEGTSAAFNFAQSPLKRFVNKSTWSQSLPCIMAVDPSGEGGDPTGYAVICCNDKREVFIKEAGSIKGRGLSDETFDELIKIAERTKVDKILVESNYNHGGYRTSLKKHYQLRKLEAAINGWNVVRTASFIPRNVDLPIEESGESSKNFGIEDFIDDTLDDLRQEKGYTVVPEEQKVLDFIVADSSDTEDETTDSQEAKIEKVSIEQEQKLSAIEAENKSVATRIFEQHQTLLADGFEFGSVKTGEKNKGKRIVKTLQPLLKSEKLFVDEAFLRQDFEKRHTQNSMLREMSWIADGFGSDKYRHDDIVDALEMAIPSTDEAWKKWEGWKVQKQSKVIKELFK